MTNRVENVDVGIGVQEEDIVDSLASEWISPSWDLGKIMRGRVGGDVDVLDEIDGADEREEEETRDRVERLEEIGESHEFGPVGGPVTDAREDELVESGERVRVLGEAREE